MLLELIEEHLPAFEYDWRARFGCRFDVPGGMSWGEAYRLTTVLLGDPSSYVGAAAAGWSFPVSPEWMVTADVYDAFVAANSRPNSKPKPYPRPWDKANARKRRARVDDAARARAERALASLGHRRSIPTESEVPGG